MPAEEMEVPVFSPLLPPYGATVILANGQFPQHPVPLSLLGKAGKIVCCDGAAAHLPTGLEPYAIVGDGDSLPDDLKNRWQDRFVHVEEQETNDLAKACRHVRDCGLGPSVILGASGLREDHALGNFSHLADFAESDPSIRIFTDSGCFAVLTNSGAFSVMPGQGVSLFSFDPCQTVTAEGLQYPLNNRTLPRWWSGTLNRAVSNEIRFFFPGNSPLLFYFPY